MYQLLFFLCFWRNQAVEGGGCGWKQIFWDLCLCVLSLACFIFGFNMIKLKNKINKSVYVLVCVFVCVSGAWSGLLQIQNHNHRSLWHSKKGGIPHPAWKWGVTSAERLLVYWSLVWVYKSGKTGIWGWNADQCGLCSNTDSVSVPYLLWWKGSWVKYKTPCLPVNLPSYPHQWSQTEVSDCGWKVQSSKTHLELSRCSSTLKLASWGGLGI